MEEIRTVWRGEGLQFDAHSGEVVTAIDGNGTAGVSPVRMLLEAVAACAGADVVDILQKGRQELEALEVRVTGERREDPPRRFTAIQVEFVVQGSVEPAKAKRAAALSFEKYCSVSHTLRPDVDLSWSVRLEDGQL